MTATVEIGSRPDVDYIPIADIAMCVIGGAAAPPTMIGMWPIASGDQMSTFSEISNA